MIRKTWNVSDIEELVGAAQAQGIRRNTRLVLALVPFVDVTVLYPCSLERAEQEVNDWNAALYEQDKTPEFHAIVSPMDTPAPSGAPRYAVIVTRT